MGILTDILGKLGIGRSDAKPVAKPGQPPMSGIGTAGPSPKFRTGTAKGSISRPNPSSQIPSTRPAEHVQPVPTVPPKEKPIPVVDVVSQLEQRAAANSQKLNWRTSIVDLLKLLDIDSSLQARKDLAKELHCPLELLEDSAQMNMWLHKTVLSRIAANGGNVPKELTD